MHSVVSQGRVEAIIHSKPRDRRLLIEEAAGLGKHRKRRRRAQLKLERTQDNLDRALDVEREARSRLRPLKRQAEAAELHERLERQSLEAALELRRDDVRSLAADLVDAETVAGAAAARARRGRAPARRRGRAPRGRRAGASPSTAGARGAHQPPVRGALRRRADRAAPRAGARLAAAPPRTRRAERRELDLIARRRRSEGGAPATERGAGAGGADSGARAGARAARGRARGRRRGRARGAARRAAGRGGAARRARCGDRSSGAQELDAAERAAGEARNARRAAEQAVEAARREAARVGAELAAVNQFLRAAGTAPARHPTARRGVGVEPGYELAVAAALGSLPAGRSRGRPARGPHAARRGRNGGRQRPARRRRSSVPPPPGAPPAPGAEPLLDHVKPTAAVAGHAAPSAGGRLAGRVARRAGGRASAAWP